MVAEPSAGHAESALGTSAQAQHAVAASEEAAPGRPGSPKMPPPPPVQHPPPGFPPHAYVQQHHSGAHQGAPKKHSHQNNDFAAREEQPPVSMPSSSSAPVGASRPGAYPAAPRAVPLAALTAEQLAYARGAPGYDGRYGWADDDPRALHGAQPPPPSLTSEALQAHGAAAGSSTDPSIHHHHGFDSSGIYASPMAKAEMLEDDHHRPRSASHPPGQQFPEPPRGVVARDRREDSLGANGPSGADRSSSSSSSSGFYDWPLGAPQEQQTQQQEVVQQQGQQQGQQQQQFAERDPYNVHQQQQQQPLDSSSANETAPAASLAAGQGDAPAHQDDSRLSDAAASDEAESASVAPSPLLPGGKQPGVDALLALASACSTAEDDNAVADAVLEL